MKFTKGLFVLAIMMLLSSSVFAQSRKEVREKEAAELGYKPYGYGFLQVQGGGATTFTNANNLKLISPTVSFGGGYQFFPEFGIRLNANGIWAVGGSHNYDAKYHYKYITGDFDLLFNLTNIFSKKAYHLFDLSLVAGLGVTHAWDNGEANEYYQNLAYSNPDYFDNVGALWGGNLNKSNFWGHNYRIGLLGNFNIAKHWAIGAEVDMNNTDDEYNSKENTCSSDWTLTAQLSITYKFGFKKYKTPVEPVVVTPEPEPAPVVEKSVDKVEVKETAKEVVKEPLKEVVYYTINKSDADITSIVNKVVAWNKKYPNAPIVVSGYADKGTGTAAINSRISKQRANKVVKALVNAGVPADKISSNAYGDTVQPFADNDSNRCVIIVGNN